MSIGITQLCGPEVDRTKNGKCSNCGTCCGDTLPLTPGDIQRIRTYVKKHHIEPIDHEPSRAWTPPRDDRCPFYQPFMLNGQHCKIYEVRPLICRHYLCRGYADPILQAKTCDAMLAEAQQETAVRKNLSLFLTARSMRYAIWPKRFPEYRETKLIIKP